MELLGTSLAQRRSTRPRPARWWHGAPVYVINMKRSTERWKRWTRWTDIRRIEAVDGRTVDIQNDPRLSFRLRKSVLEHEVRADDQQINSVGAVGCGLSHGKALQTVLETSAAAAFVFEDDCKIPPEAEAFERLGDYLTSVLDSIADELPANPEDLDVLLLGPALYAYDDTLGHGSTDVVPWAHDFASDLVRSKQPLLRRVSTASTASTASTDVVAPNGLLRVRDFVGLHGALWTRGGATRALQQPIFVPLEGHIDRIVSIAGRFDNLVVVTHTRLNDFVQDTKQGSTLAHEIPWYPVAMRWSILGLSIALVAAIAYIVYLLRCRRGSSTTTATPSSSTALPPSTSWRTMAPTNVMSSAST